MNKSKSTTIGAALTDALSNTRSLFSQCPASRFLPLLIATLESLQSCIPAGMKRLTIRCVTIEVTRIYAREQNGNEILLWEENSWLPFASFANIVTCRSREIAWRTSNWIVTDSDLTPLLGSVSATLWLLDLEAGLPFCISKGGAIGSF